MNTTTSKAAYVPLTPCDSSDGPRFRAIARKLSRGARRFVGAVYAAPVTLTRDAELCRSFANVPADDRARMLVWRTTDMLGHTVIKAEHEDALRECLRAGLVEVVRVAEGQGVARATDLGRRVYLHVY